MVCGWSGWVVVELWDCDKGADKKYCLVDLAALVIGTSRNRAAEALSRALDKYPEVTATCGYFKFKGRGQDWSRVVVVGLVPLEFRGFEVVHGWVVVGWLWRCGTGTIGLSRI